MRRSERVVGEGGIGEAGESFCWRRERARRGREVASHVPAEEVGVLGVLNEARSHHDGLEALPVNGPQLDVGES